MALQLSYLLSLLLLILLLPYSTTAQTSSNQSLGSSLTAQEKDSYWASPSGDFAFGFQQIGKGGYLLAIWFNKLPEKTIVWSANGEHLVPGGSKVELTKDGKFVLNDPSNGTWKVHFAGPGVAYAAVLDTGNFVLASQNSSLLWQSFDHPTDTMLPSQTLSLGSKLVARYSEMNYSKGRFQFQLRLNGSLVLQTRAYPMDDSITDYWPRPEEPVGSGFEVVFNQSGSIIFTTRNGSIVKSILSNPSSTQGFYQRAIMEYDGVLRHYVYPKSIMSGNWSSLPNFIPKNICNSMPMNISDSGACGNSSYCLFDDFIQRPKCLCPDGYTYIDPEDVMKGCKQNFPSQSCDEAFPESDLYYFKSLLNADWPGSSNDIGYLEGQNEDLCRTACLRDCRCAVAIYRKERCWKKKAPFSNGRVDNGDNGKALIKIRKDNSTLKHPGANSKKKDQSTVILIVSVLGSSVFLTLLFLLAAFLLVFRFKYWKPKALKPYEVMLGMNLRSYTYEELTEATNEFREELGRGGFAIVYKGVLEYEDRKLVAVKRMNDMVKEGDDMVKEDDRGFKVEVSAIGRTNHRNLVKLLGFCNEGQYRLLVYEFMSNGSLASFLFGASRPIWSQRIQIALEIARGLFYLHEECSTQIIHCDIKPQNILLDDSFTARISDFGIAKLLKMDQTRTTTTAKGTLGYMAPEWFKKMPVTTKVDVYSFGILLQELICCKKSFFMAANWAYDCYKESKLDLLVENDEEAINDMKRVEKYVLIAIWCIQDDPSQRPTMKKVVQMMEGVVEVPFLPSPSITKTNNEESGTDDGR